MKHFIFNTVLNETNMFLFFVLNQMIYDLKLFVLRWKKNFIKNRERGMLLITLPGVEETSKNH